MSREWYYQQEGRQSGPVPARRLQEMAASGQLRPTDLLWAAGLDEWSPAGESKTLFASSSPCRTFSGTRSAEEPILAEAVTEHTCGSRASAGEIGDGSPFSSEVASQASAEFPVIETIQSHRSRSSTPAGSGGFFGGLVYAIGFVFGLYSMMQVSGVFDGNSKRQNASAGLAPAAPYSLAREAVGKTGVHERTRPQTKQTEALAEVEALIERGGDLNARDGKGFTPIHWTARNGYEDVAKLLVEHGVDVNAKETAVGQATPLHVASTYNHLAVAKLLLASGANVNSTDKWGGTPLQYAAFNGHNDLVVFFLANGAEINAKDRRYGITVLHVAVAGGKASTVELLIAKGADINARNNMGESPLATALRMNHKSIAEMLRKKR